MRLVLRTLVVAAVGLGLIAAAPTAQAKKEKKEHPVKGVVASVVRDKDAMTITVHIPEHKNKKTNETKPAEDKTIKITAETTFVKVSGKKGAETKDPATFADVKEDDHVVVTVKEGVAVEVAIHPKHKKKNV